ncbi:replication initiation and membrane attachment family protein [Halalkalibacter sp. APA_J-10(15)]|uniref:replication initiation and membrane attachment family protein n=1 Tax=unclassified Halalkalibacter TaxID=2893063 RepID=UPI001FF147BD|nr:DnaD domain protein [Halalkalibacter sp. APA_J-10(15)]MCK0471358.1 DnaD domain protein [Halalkalibacter sp. APA_J-10(15)]
MTWHWKKLVPVDRYSVRIEQYITEEDKQTITLLYQPLIGAIANSLYVTLLSHLEKEQYWSKEYTHRQLMIVLGTSLEIIYEERKKLEAVGLLKTHKATDDNGGTYIYDIQPPMTPKHFFENDVLSVYLFNRLGKTHYRQLRDRFVIETLHSQQFQDVTYAFDEVFTSIHHSEMVSSLKSEDGNDLKKKEGQEVITKEEHNDFKMNGEDFDFELLEKSLTSTINADQILTFDVRQAIVRLAFVYRIEPLEMSSILLQALLHDDYVDIDELRKKTQEWYKVEHGTEPPGLALRTQPMNKRTMNNRQALTEEERTIQFYENTSPLSLLEIRSGGAKVPLADVKIIESLMLDHKLHPGVVNVLLDFILWSQDMKLSKALVDKIGGHWSRKKVQTVKEAMTIALKEQEKTKKQSNSQSTSIKRAHGQRKTNSRRDQLPKWLLEEQEKQKNDANDQSLKPKAERVQKQEKSFAELLAERNKRKE